MKLRRAWKTASGILNTRVAFTQTTSLTLLMVCALMKRMLPSNREKVLPLTPMTVTSPSIRTHRSSTRIAMQSPSSNYSICSVLISPSRLKMNSTLALLLLPVSSGCSTLDGLAVDWLMIVAALVGYSWSVLSLGGSKMEGTCLKERLSRFSLSNLSGSM